MADEYCIIISTTDSKEESASLARSAVALKLAACVQTVPINSTYMWEGEIEDSEEFLLLFKTTVPASKRLQEYLEANHSYDVPEIIQIPVTGGGSPYLQWIAANTSGN